MSLNQILLIGRAGTDPQMRYTPQGTAVTDFRLAVSNNKRGADGEWQEETEWFTITAWDRQAETVNQNLTKGQRVFVEGRLSTSQWTGKDGQQRTSLEVRAFRVMPLDKPGATGDGFNAPPSERDAEAQVAPASNGAPAEDVEELPW